MPSTDEHPSSPAPLAAARIDVARPGRRIDLFAVFVYVLLAGALSAELYLIFGLS